MGDSPKKIGDLLMVAAIEDQVGGFDGACRFGSIKISVNICNGKYFHIHHHQWLLGVFCGIRSAEDSVTPVCFLLCI